MYAYLGSSPLARGLRHHPIRGGPRRGIIPARAGFTWRGTRPAPWGPDHPRSRGVYMARNSAGSLGSGSSPLARGLPTSSATGPWPGTDHPRSRGVYALEHRGQARAQGSSPLARGLQMTTAAHGEESGIIPARAGFTPSERSAGSQRPDHPRSRGVYDEDGLGHFTVPGSSPLARGLPPSPPTSSGGSRIIPARAGFTDAYDKGALDVRDHPRSRGVYDKGKPVMGATFGSSPLARGLRHPPGDADLPVRIIPARAGFTRSG